MDPISVSGRCRSKISVPERSSRTVDRGEAGIHDGREVETQGLPGSRVDPVEFVKNRGVQHREGEDYVRSVEGLSNMYEKPSAMNKVYLMRRLFNLQMSKARSVSYHINEFNMIVSQLNLVDINFEDEIKALILMSSMRESWDTVVVAISSFRVSEKLNFDDIPNVVLSEDIRKREVGDSSGSALSVDRKGRSKMKSQNTHGRSKSMN